MDILVKQLWYSRIVICNSTGAMALLLYEFALTFDDECELIWTKPRGSLIRWQYIFTRYFGLGSQIYTNILTRHATSGMSDPSYCLLFYAWRLVGCQSILTSVETVLIFRVHALYQNRNIFLGLIFFLLIELLVLLVNSAIIMPKLVFDSSCLSQLPISLLVQYGAISLSFQTFIFCLTLYKHVSAARSGRRTRIVTLMIRDGVFAYLIIFAATITTLVCSSTAGSLATQTWLMSLVSCIGCRLILNLQRLGLNERGDTTTWELTTFSQTCFTGSFP